VALEYEYYCESNGRSITVRHGINEEVCSWAELCQQSGEPLGDTDPSAEVTRSIFGGILSLARRVSKEPRKSDYDPLLHGQDNCIPGGCGSHSKNLEKEE